MASRAAKSSAAKKKARKPAPRAAASERPARPARPAAAPARKSKVAFPRKNQPPSEAEFAARLPLAAGKRFEMVRGFLKKQRSITEELYYYGPKTGWAYRYLRGPRQSVCAIMIHDDRLLGILALSPEASAAIDWAALSPVAQKARKSAHGSPSVLWLDLPLEASGAADFKALLKAKLKVLPTAGSSPSPTASASPPPPPLPPPPPPIRTPSRSSSPPSPPSLVKG